MSDELVFAVNGVVVRLSASDVSPEKKLAVFLRDDQMLRGTKIGCGEGGCGACSALLSRWDKTMNKVVTVSANACLRPLTSLHGYLVTTVEGIGSPSFPHAIQKRFRDLSASQCGFCTPGFVVSVYGQLAKKKESTMRDIESSLDGNLCRCTGYRPILDAAKSFAIDSNVVDHLGKTDLGMSEGMDVQNEIDAMFPAVLKDLPVAPAHFKSPQLELIRVATAAEAMKALAEHGTDAALVVSQTSAGVYKEHLPRKRVLIDVSNIPSTRAVFTAENYLVVGAATPISTFAGLVLAEGVSRGGAVRQTLTALHDIVMCIANVHIRDVASIGGNIMMAKTLGFASDLATPLCGIGARVTYTDATGSHTQDIAKFLQSADSNLVLETIEVPLVSPGTVFYCFRQAIRCINAHAILNAAFRADIDDKGIISNTEAFFGAAGEFDQPGKNAPRRNESIIELLNGKTISKALIRSIVNNFHAEGFISGTYKLAHRQKLVKAFLMKFIEDVRLTIAHDEVRRPYLFTVHGSEQKYSQPDPELLPVGDATPRSDGIDHASGTAVYISDMKEPKDTLYLAWVQSSIAKGKVKHIPVELLKGLAGNPRFFGPNDFPPGTRNEVLNLLTSFMPLPFLKNHPVMTADVEYHGQNIGVIIADSTPAAQAAAKVLSAAVEYSEDSDAVITTEQALKAQKVFFAAPTVVGNPDATDADKELLHIASHVSLNSQKHFYMETHAAFAIPHDSYTTVYLASQGVQLIANCIAFALGKPLNEVQMKQHRIGGSFGAKLVAEHGIMCAVLARLYNRPVKFHLDRNTDMRSQGGRQETTADVHIDLQKDGFIKGVVVDCYKNCGLHFDWSSFTVMGLLPGHIGSVYEMPNKKIKSVGVQSNTVPRAPVRAPGEIEAAYITEEIIDRVAFELGVHSQVIRERNFRKEMSGNIYTFPEMYEALMVTGGWRQRIDDATAFNAAHHAKKRGVAIVPFKYHVSCNGAFAQINIFADGSVLVHHCGVEMGQGLIVKVLQAACMELSKVCGPLPLSNFKSAGNDSFALPLGGITGGSVGSETNVFSVVQAAAKLVERMKPVADALPEEKRTWQAVVGSCYKAGIPTTATGQFAGSGIKVDYNIFCAGAAEVEVDVYTGHVSVNRVDIKYDAAKSLNPAVDIGQAEGAFMMGLGYLLLEDAKLCDKTGAYPHDGTWEYKIPTVQDVPRVFNVELIHNDKFKDGVLSSKASGEPPLCVAPCLTSAIRQCIVSARKDAGLGGYPELTVPWTCDKIALACGNKVDEDA
jgi:xanthine dehydrogenase/oxidase